MVLRVSPTLDHMEDVTEVMAGPYNNNEGLCAELGETE
jgi:hypothetical protein